MAYVCALLKSSNAARSHVSESPTISEGAALSQILLYIKRKLSKKYYTLFHKPLFQTFIPEFWTVLLNSTPSGINMYEYVLVCGSFEMCLSLLTTVCVPLHSPVCQIRGAEGSLWKLNVQLHILNGSALGALCPHPSLHRISLLIAALLQSFSSQWPLFTLPLSQQSMQSRMNECAFSSKFPLTSSAQVSKCSISEAICWAEELAMMFIFEYHSTTLGLKRKVCSNKNSSD